MPIIISKNPSLCWEFADFYEQEQGGGHINFSLVSVAPY